MTILLSNIDRQHYTDRAPWTPYWSDCYKHMVNPYLEIANNNPNLVICYGDSWSWGDSLGDSNAGTGVDDLEFRSKNIFGFHLSQMLNADFVNVATPGIFNYWIHDRLDILCRHDIKRLSSSYDKIYIIITLTELGRDFEFYKYVDDFKTFYNWETDSECTAEKILIEAERFDFLKLKKINNQLPKNCHMIVGRNFTNTFKVNKSILTNLVPENWTNILLKKQNMSVLTDVSIMSFGVDRFNKFIHAHGLDNDQYKDWFINNLSILANKQIDYLNNSMYNYKKASKHPTPDGHKLWADYLIKYIKSIE